MKFSELELELRKLEATVANINEQTKEAISAGGGKICGSCEFFFIAIARRTGAFTDAFCKAVRDDNHFVAPALIRPNLEHLLVIQAAQEYQPGDIHPFTSQLLNGHRFRELQNQAGEKMTERVLVDSLSKALDGHTSGSVKGLYKWSNKFVHFDPQHLMSSFKHFDDEGKFELIFSGPTYEIPAVQSQDVRKWIGAMKAINFFIYQHLLHWTDLKTEL